MTIPAKEAFQESKKTKEFLAKLLIVQIDQEINYSIRLGKNKTCVFNKPYYESVNEHFKSYGYDIKYEMLPFGGFYEITWSENILKGKDSNITLKNSEQFLNGHLYIKRLMLCLKRNILLIKRFFLKN